MRLRNKKTGEIGKLLKLQDDDDLEVMTDDKCYLYKTLAEVAEQWEDYEEPKEWWFIDCTGFIKHGEGLFTEKSYIKDIQQIGNYFETKEEAEKAVDKLKAWKRLKDNGFRFKGTNNSKRKTGYFINYYLGKSFNSQNECEQAMKDLELLFGGEDE